MPPVVETTPPVTGTVPPVLLLPPEMAVPPVDVVPPVALPPVPPVDPGGSAEQAITNAHQSSQAGERDLFERLLFKRVPALGRVRNPLLRQSPAPDRP
jgi:hypothetical protein